jgi:hypothetical protein
MLLYSLLSGRGGRQADSKQLANVSVHQLPASGKVSRSYLLITTGSSVPTGLQPLAFVLVEKQVWNLTINHRHWLFPTSVT